MQRCMWQAGVTGLANVNACFKKMSVTDCLSIGANKLICLVRLEEVCSNPYGAGLFSRRTKHTLLGMGRRRSGS